MASVSDSNISRTDGTESDAENDCSGDLDRKKVAASVSGSKMGRIGHTNSDAENDRSGDLDGKKVVASVSGSSGVLQQELIHFVDYLFSRLKSLSSIEENKQSPEEKEEVIYILSRLKNMSTNPLYSDITRLRKFEQIIPSPSIPQSVRLDVLESSNSIAVSTITNSNDYSLHDSRTNNNPTPFVENSTNPALCTHNTAANVTIVTSSTKGMDENRLQDISSSRSSLSLYSVGKPNGLFRGSHQFYFIISILQLIANSHKMCQFLLGYRGDDELISNVKHIVSLINNSKAGSNIHVLDKIDKIIGVITNRYQTKENMSIDQCDASEFLTVLLQLFDAAATNNCDVCI